MPIKKKVILYGGSLFIAGLDASLSTVPGLEIQRVEAHAGNDLELVRAGTPDVIIVDLGVASKTLTLALLQKFPGVTMIGLDPESDQLLILSVQQQKAQAAADLVKVIQAP
jgi:DNA-binding NarL/FixJ family response regulator